MEKAIQFVQISPEELQRRIMEGLKAEIESLKKELQPKNATVYLTRNEVRDLLKVNLSTVHNLTKRGKLKSYGLGARIYYKLHEVEEAIKPLNE